jgi:hypothetical protein
MFEFLARATKQEKETKVIQIGKEEIKQSLFKDNMILYSKNTKESIRRLLDLMNTFSMM